MLIRINNTPINDLNLKIDNNKIEKVSTLTYLGITIRENLKQNTHVDSLCGKILGLIGAVKRLGNRLNQSTKIAFYHASFNSILSYLMPVWGTSMSQFNKNKLQIVQNKTIRTIFAYDYNHLNLNTSTIRKNHNILDIDQLLLFSCAILMYKIDNKLIKTNH